MKKGINRELIFKESEKLLKSKGAENLSVRELSSSLGVQPASLYNHIDGIKEIYEYLSVTAADKLREALENAISGKERDEAFIAGGIAYRKFAENNREFYTVLIHSRNARDAKQQKLCKESFEPLCEIIKSYGKTKEETVNFLRAFRSFMHGFVEITHNGFMQKGNVSRDETYVTVLKEFLKVLKGD